MYIKKLSGIFIVAGIIFFWGCKGSTLNLKLSYGKIEGLKKQDRVIFDGNHVGHVDKVVLTEKGNYVVDISIKPEFKHAATEFSEFYIVFDSLNHSDKAIEIELTRSGGKPLKNGTMVQGSVRSVFDKLIHNVGKNTGHLINSVDGAMRQLKADLQKDSQNLSRGMEEAIEDFSIQIEKFTNKLPDSKDFNKLEQTFDELIREFEKSESDVRNKIKKEILPEIQKEINRLRNQLYKEDRRQELAPLEKKMEEFLKT